MFIIGHLERSAHDDEQVGLGHVSLGLPEEALRKVLPEEHDVRLHQPAALRARRAPPLRQQRVPAALP
eukprot:1888044-Pyramimonas_sp.AAC.2